MFLSTIAAASAALVAQADEANQVYTECMFSVAREAPEDLPARDLAMLLQSSCVEERASLRTLLVEVRQQNGETRRDAEARWRKVRDGGVASVVRAHRIGSSLGR